MPNETFVEKIASGLNGSASVKSVFGDPVQVGDKTVIPVAGIAYGFGGGYGQGEKKPGSEEQKAMGEGAGGGGGIYVKPKGVYEITPKATRFIPDNPAKYVLIGMAAGFLLRTLLLRKKREK